MCATVMVTGGCGVIGSWACRELVRGGHDVVALDLREDRSYMGPEAAGVPVVQGDVLHLPRLIGAIQEHRVETVVHLAALIARCEDDPYGAVRVNVGGTTNVLEAARLCGCSRVVFVTSRAALGPMEGEYAAPTFRPVAEGFPRRPITVYGSTKLAAEAIALAYARRHGMDVLGLRFPALYAPGRLARHGGFAVLSRVIEAAATGRELDLPAGGRQPDDVLFVADAARAVALAVSAPRAHLPVYHISSGALTRPLDFLAALQRLFPGCRVRIGDAQPGGAAGYPSYSRFDDTAARRDLGYRAGFDVPLGIATYIEAWRAADPGAGVPAIGGEPS